MSTNNGLNSERPFSLHRERGRPQYFAIKDRDGEVRAIQPFFMLDQDLLAGMPPKIQKIFYAVRRV
jgi:hypothetical protein